MAVGPFPFAWPGPAAAESESRVGGSLPPQARPVDGKHLRPFAGRGRPFPKEGNTVSQLETLHHDLLRWQNRCLEFLALDPYDPATVRVAIGHWVAHPGRFKAIMADIRKRAPRVPKAQRELHRFRVLVATSNIRAIHERSLTVLYEFCRRNGIDPTPFGPDAGTFADVNGPRIVDRIALALKGEAAKAAEAASQAKEDLLPWDGPEGEQLAPLPRRLLRYMYAHNKADITDLVEAVWGKDPAAVTDNAINQALYKSNAFLGKQGYPRHLERVRGESRIRWA